MIAVEMCTILISDRTKKEHERLLALFDDRVQQYRREEIDLERVVEFLFEWFAMHRTQVDTRLAKYIAVA
jgi:hemerythrin